MLRLMGPVLAAALLAPLPQAAQAQGRGAGDQPVDGLAARDRRPRGQGLARVLRRARQPAAVAQRIRPALGRGFDADASPAHRAVRRGRSQEAQVRALARQVDTRTTRRCRRRRQGRGRLSTAFAAYVRAMRAAGREEMIYESAALAPVVPTARAALDTAAASAEGSRTTLPRCAGCTRSTRRCATRWRIRASPRTSGGRCGPTSRACGRFRRCRWAATCWSTRRAPRCGCTRTASRSIRCAWWSASPSCRRR